jgi:hypothetical protein
MKQFQIIHDMASGRVTTRTYNSRADAMHEWDSMLDIVMAGEACTLREVFDDEPAQVMSHYKPMIPREDREEYS